MSWFLVLLIAANIAISSAIIIQNRRSERRVKDRLTKAFAKPTKTANSKKPAKTTTIQELWPQFESLIALYRREDNRREIPPTRAWAASPDFLLLLVKHIETARPQTIVECGSGTSTLLMARALQRLGSGHIYTLEHHEKFLNATQQMIDADGLSNYVTFIHAPLTPRRYSHIDQEFNWYGFDEGHLPRSIEMLVIDGPPGATNRYARFPAGPELFPRLAPDGRAFLDDSKRRDEQALKNLWSTTFPDIDLVEHDAEKGCLEIAFSK